MTQVFFHSPDLLEFPVCHAIYTVAPYLPFINPGIAEVYNGCPHVMVVERVHHDMLHGEQRRACVKRHPWLPAAEPL